MIRSCIGAEGWETFAIDYNRGGQEGSWDNEFGGCVCLVSKCLTLSSSSLFSSFKTIYH